MSPGPFAAAAVMAALFCLPACNGSPPETAAAAEGGETAPPDRTAMLAMACSGCHSPAGGAIVSLEGYTEETLRTSLSAYKNETGGTTVMHRLMRGYSQEDIQAVSGYLAKGGAE